MNIIKLFNDTVNVITVDNDVITVDSTSITVDVDGNSTPNIYSVTLLPSTFYSDMKLVLKNELTEEINEVDVTAVKDKGYTVITFLLEGIKDKDSFEGRLYNVDKTDEVYRGKFFATIQNDLQEYTMTPKTNNKIIM